MNAKEKGTRDRILGVANDLFAEKGYGGTSIREISKQAQVSLSAINYHFESKESLYAYVFEMNYQWMEESIEKIGADTKIDTKEFTWRLFEFFVNNSSPLLNTFKIFLYQDSVFPKDMGPQCGGNMGPPGQKVFIEKIRNDVGPKIPEDGVHWAMRMIFSDIVHIAIAMSAPMMKEALKSEKHWQLSEKRKSFQYLVEAILNYLKQNPRNWQD